VIDGENAFVDRIENRIAVGCFHVLSVLRTVANRNACGFITGHYASADGGALTKNACS
jgi:hypothetical protein